MDPAARLDRLGAALRTLTDAVLTHPATTPPQLRQAAYDGVPDDPAVAAYVALVDRQPYRVTDTEVAALREDGLSDDEIFDVTLAAALGAAQRRLDAALGLLSPDGRP